jgi:MFS family permease
VVGVLTLIYVVSFIDRQILDLLVGPIKRDMELSDTQVSLLMGFSFALFYTICGIPIGRLADSKSRRGIIAIGLILWSFMTALCGSVKQYWQFFLARMGVGVGEAALSPAAYSIITDYFPKNRLGTAMSVYGMGIYNGSGLAYILGGLVVGWTEGMEVLELPVVGRTFPWQLVFFVVGLPGIALAMLLMTVKESVRRNSCWPPRIQSTIPMRIHWQRP